MVEQPQQWRPRLPNRSSLMSRRNRSPRDSSKSGTPRPSIGSSQSSSTFSPANKRAGEGRNLYVQKQQELKEGKVNLVEIDLVREGQYTMSLPRHRVPSAAWNGYRACIWRSWRPTRYEIFPFPLQMCLPAIRIPLRESDEDVMLDLQAMIDQAYRNGRYDSIDYRRPPEPPLDAADATWADELLRSKGLRTTNGAS